MYFFFQFYLVQLDNIYINTEDGPKNEYIFRVILHGSISFSVDSANDAHIALATKAKESEPIVEILLGGWKNTASAIRYNKQTPDKVLIMLTQCALMVFFFLFTCHQNTVVYYFVEVLTLCS